MSDFFRDFTPNYVTWDSDVNLYTKPADFINGSTFWHIHKPKDVTGKFCNRVAMAIQEKLNYYTRYYGWYEDDEKTKARIDKEITRLRFHLDRYQRRADKHYT